jgi:hypothetical protein
MSQPNPYGAPTAPQAQVFEGELYVTMPIYRRNGPLSVVLFVALVLAFVGPFLLTGVSGALGVAGPAVVGTLVGSPLLATCIVVLTGPVYYDAYEQAGVLKRWSIGNKVVAGLLLLGWIYSVTRTFL